MCNSEHTSRSISSLIFLQNLLLENTRWVFRHLCDRRAMHRIDAHGYVAWICLLVWPDKVKVDIWYIVLSFMTCFGHIVLSCIENVLVKLDLVVLYMVF